MGYDFCIRDIVSSSYAVSGAAMKNLSWPDHLSLSCLIDKRKASARESSWIYRSSLGRSQCGILATARHETDQWSRKLATFMEVYSNDGVCLYLTNSRRKRKMVTVRFVWFTGVLFVYGKVLEVMLLAE